MGKHSVIVAGVLACASLHVYAGLFDSVSDLTGGIVKIDESDPSKEDASANAVSAHKAKIYSKKMSTSEYIAARDAFIDMVAEKYGASASAFNIHNKDFGEIREYFPEEAEKFAQSAGRLRGAAFSELKFTSDKKEGLKLLKKLASDETELRTIFDGLKVKTTHRQAEIAEAQRAEREARELAEKQRQAEIAETQRAEREAREFAGTRVLDVGPNTIQPAILNQHGDVSVNDERQDTPMGDAVRVEELPQGQEVVEAPADKHRSQNVDWRIILIALGVLLLALLIGVLIALLTKKPSRQEMPKSIRSCYFVNRWDYAFTFLSIVAVVTLPICLTYAKVDKAWLAPSLAVSGGVALLVNIWVLSKANASWGYTVLMFPFRVVMGVLGPLLPVASVIMTLAGISAVNEGSKRIGTAQERIRKNQGWMTRQDESDIKSGRNSVSSGIATAILGAIFGWISKKLWEAINSRTRSLVGWESWN